MKEAGELGSRLPVFAFDRLSDHVIITDAGNNEAGERRIVYVNPAYLKTTGYTREEIIGQSPRMFRGVDTNHTTARRISDALRSGKNVRETILNYTKSGVPYLTELNIAPIRDEAGTIIYYCSIQRDVSSAARTTEERELEQRLTAVGERVGAIGTWAYLLKEDRLIWSEGTYRIFGLEPGTPFASALDAERYIAPKDRAALQEHSIACIKQQTRQSHEVSGIRETGELINLVAMTEPIMGEDGRTWAIAGAIRDITEEKKIESALDDSLLQHQMMEHHFVSARKAGRIAVFDYAIEHHQQHWSDELFEITGIDKEHFIASSAEFLDFVDPADRVRFHQHYARTLETGEGFAISVRFHRPDGDLLWLDMRADLRESASGRHLIGIARDVTSEVNASRKLKQQEERFRIIADTLSDVLWDYDFETQAFWITPNWPAKLRISPDEASFDPMKWSAIIIEADRKQAEASLADAILLGSTRWQCCFRIKDPDGHIEHIEIKASILRREQGGVYRMLGNVRNVTLEKKAEEGFTRSRALEAVGKMTGGVAHDFNNLLMIIQGNTELLSLSELDPEDRESVSLIEKAARSAGELTNRLLTFSGQTRLNTARVDLQTAITHIGPLLKSALTESVELELQVNEDIWDIEVDQSELEQAIINLAVNARDAMPEGGKVHVTCKNTTITQAMIGPSLQISPGRYVCISVADTGTGMSEEVAARAIDPFFTTKEFGKGTGLGLSSVYGFAQQSGGTIQIDSEPGRGTTINILLPASERPASAPAEDLPMPGISPDKDLRILVVEDQKEVRRHVEKLLQKSGFEVTSTKDAADALDILQSDASFDILFTDIIMPGGMNGVELSDEARRIVPGIKVLFTSGFPASALDRFEASGTQKVPLLKKPYSRTELISALRELTQEP